MLRDFDYCTASTLDEAVHLLGKHGSGARPLAGGTDLLVEMKHDPRRASAVVDLSRIEALRGIELTAQGLRIGAMATHTEIMASALVAEHAPAMIDAAHTVGAVQTRNLGTLGGNLITCVPSMDSGPTLLVLDAEVSVIGPAGLRSMPLGDLFLGPRRTSLAADEILVDVLIPTACLGKPASFRKFGLRKGQALALVNAAASMALDPDEGTIVEPRIALGAVAPTVFRADEAEAVLAGCKPGRELFAEAGRVAASQARPIDDFRASAHYRIELIQVLTRRVLEASHGMASAGTS